MSEKTIQSSNLKYNNRICFTERGLPSEEDGGVELDTGDHQQHGRG